MDLVNEKIVDGKTYTLYRDSKDPKVNYIKLGKKVFKLKEKAREVWKSKSKIKAH